MVADARASTAPIADAPVMSPEIARQVGQVNNLEER